MSLVVLISDQRHSAVKPQTQDAPNKLITGVLQTGTTLQRSSVVGYD